MALLCKIALIFVLVPVFYIPSLEGRKVLNMENTKDRPNVPVHNLVPSHVLQNGPTPTPTPSPSSKSVQMAQNGRILVTLHNAAIDRFMESVPSPGIGHKTR
ncbi:hypothetical protein Ddye_026518 [Dipteronia dyeriana]|uniref:Uncharacterized protein n=1 Tax=Dipteronia dyeriana TaxID=168575 RepID=A0AAD9TN52_9ROSI|nr:hypothetical protein Ddye_026518 [Dipteronia dyeriana]